MTALAMIIGMAPMALGLGEGGEQNAPLGRAVIGGLLFATIATLIFVPVVFSLVHKLPAPRRGGSPGVCMPPEHSSAPSFRKLRHSRVAAAVALVMVVVAGILTRERSSARLRDWTEKQAMPTVAVAKPGTRQSPTLNLPGRLEAFSRAPIFARVSGYLKEWKVDIGMPVKAGQLLAEIDAPDLDQQLLQVRADLLNMQSTARLSEATSSAARRSPNLRRGLSRISTRGWPISRASRRR